MGDGGDQGGFGIEWEFLGNFQRDFWFEDNWSTFFYF